jgi:hypothetical protein
VWFVCFDKGRGITGKKWGEATAADCKRFTNMFVTWSSGGEYVNAVDL